MSRLPACTFKCVSILIRNNRKEASNYRIVGASTNIECECIVTQHKTAWFLIESVKFVMLYFNLTNQSQHFARSSISIRNI